MQAVDADPKFTDLTKENDPEIIKEIIDLTKDCIKVEFVDLTDNDLKIIKEIINLTKDNNPTLVKKITAKKKDC